jgi:hypothetical protein
MVARLEQIAAVRHIDVMTLVVRLVATHLPDFLAAEGKRRRADRDRAQRDQSVRRSGRGRRA